VIKKIILASGFVLGLAACTSNKLPKDVMTPDSLKSVMWELFAVGELKVTDTTAAVRLHLKDSATSAFDYVLRIHNMSKETFMHSFKYYEAHADKQMDLIDTLIAYNDRQTTFYQNRYEKADSIRKKKAADTTKVKPATAAKRDSLKIDSIPKTPKSVTEHILQRRNKLKLKGSLPIKKGN